MAHYTRPNLSRTARDRTTSFVKMLATLAETFVFIYIGVSLFLEDQAWDRGLTWAFLVCWWCVGVGNNDDSVVVVVLVVGDNDDG